MKPLRLVASFCTLALAWPLAMGTAASLGPAADPSGPSARALANAQALERADETLREARERCLRKHAEGANARESCLAQARRAHAGTLSSLAGKRLPAVQTESSAVDRTGAAPVAVDERTPGVPARRAGEPAPGR